MTNPTSGWDPVPITGKWMEIDRVTPRTGSIVFTLSQRVIATDGTAIYAEGGVLSVVLGTGPVNGSIATAFPASDDPDITPNGWLIKVEERLDGGGGKVYYIEPKLSDLPDGINLNLIVVPDNAPSAPPPAYMRGVAGGLAALNPAGQVVDADGVPVGGGGGGSGSATLAGLTDVDTAVKSSGQALTWNGTKWVPVTPASSETAATIKTKLGITTLTGSNTGDQTIPPAETGATLLTKLGIPSISGTNTGDQTIPAAETGPSILSKLGVSTLSGSNTGDETAATVKSKLSITTLSGSNTGDQTTVSGNAGTATKLATARAIGSASFDGTAGVTLAAIGAATSAQGSKADTSVQTVNSVAPDGAGNVVVAGGSSETGASILSKLGIPSISGTNTGDQTTVAGLAGSATKLATARTIGGVAFDGTANIAVTLASTATTLATARTINGVSFNGSANITVADATKVPTTTTVNGKALSSNVTLAASDVGAAPTTVVRAVSADASGALGDYVQVDASAGAVTITAPAPTSGREFTVEKTDGTSNIVTVSGGTFDGNTSVQFVTQNGGGTFIGNGTAFRVKSVTVNTPGPQGPPGADAHPGLALLGFEPLPRWLGQQGATCKSGVAALVIGKCYTSATVTKLRATSRTATSGATLARMGIYTLPDTYGSTGSGTLTLVARTASIGTMFDSGYNDQSVALATAGGYPASFTFLAGKYYALALLQVGSTVDPSFFGSPGWGGMMGLVPALVQGFASQADLGATYTVASGTAYGDAPWIGGIA